MKRTRKVYTTRNEKIVDFVIGFVGWCLINGLMYAGSITILSSFDVQQNAIGITLLVLPLVINIAALIYFAMRRRWIAWGALAAFALLLVGVLVIGLLVYAICFNSNAFQ